jgi:SAM-dependent methyltransferase
MNSPSTWVQRFIHEIPRSNGQVLDLACGSGRHTRLLIEAGFDVVALDRDTTSFPELEKLGAQCQPFDLEKMPLVWPFPADYFAGIIVTNYLHRPLMPWLLHSLADQALLIYETFAKGNEQFGRPRNPDFLLHDNELLQHFIYPTSLNWQQQCLAFEHLHVKNVNQTTQAVVQRICVRRSRR